MFRKKNLIFIGAPGAGKGTVANLLRKVHPFVHISTGDLLREEVKKESELGKAAARIMKEGGLVPDDVVVALVAGRLAEKDSDDGFILDGFPRTLRQAELLDEMLERNGRNIDAVIYLQVDDELILKRLTARESCRNCGAIYNKIFRPSKVAGICDVCGGELYQRPDDSIETAKDRLRVFYKNNQPLIDHYEKKGLLNTITTIGDAQIIVELEDILS